MPMQRRRATIRDVAKAAGLSPATVSRFLNGKIRLPPRSSQRIRDAIRELQYQPNATARNLSLGQTELLGLIVPNVSNPFFATIAEAAEEAAFQAGFGVLLCNARDDAERELRYLSLLARSQVDGVLLLTNSDAAAHAELSSTVNASGNVVILDEDIEDVQAPKLFVENEGGARMATEHLWAMGHRRIAHIGGPVGLYSAERRLGGYLATLHEQGLDPEPELVIRGPYTREFGASAFAQVRDADASAVFCASDFVAMGLLEAAHEHGVRVPEDLSVVGFDDSAFVDMLQPAMTTVRQPAERLGAEGMTMLIDLVRGESSAAVSPTLLPVELVIRDSVAPYRAEGQG
jgi:LacI family transcriptional regulator